MKTYQRKNTILRLSIIAIILFAFAQMTATAQTTAFNFQGRLNDGSSAANGRYDLQFILYDALVGGNQVGSIVTKNNQQLINGIFSTQLDFGASAFNGGDRFLEIQLRPTGMANAAPNAFVILGARQQLLSVPYAVKSLNANNAVNAQSAQAAVTAVSASTATSATNATNAQTAVNSQQLGGVAASQYVQKDNPALLKASIFVNPYLPAGQQIVRCFNSQLSGAAATTVPCGFTAASYTDDGATIGHWRINFNFNTSNSFFSVTTVTTRTMFSRQMTVSSVAGGNTSNGGTGDIENCAGNQCVSIVTKYASSGDFTNDPFIVLVY